MVGLIALGLVMLIWILAWDTPSERKPLDG
jgi:hypothetical protein